MEISASPRVKRLDAAAENSFMTDSFLSGFFAASSRCSSICQSSFSGKFFTSADMPRRDKLMFRFRAVFAIGMSEIL